MRWAMNMSGATRLIFIGRPFKVHSCLRHRKPSSKRSRDTELLWVQRLDICLELWPSARMLLSCISVHSLWPYVLESGLEISEICVSLTLRILGILCMVLIYMTIQISLLSNFPTSGLLNRIWLKLALTFKACVADELLDMNMRALAFPFNRKLFHWLSLRILFLLLILFSWIQFCSFGFDGNLFSEWILVFDELEGCSLMLVFTWRDALTYVWTWLMTSFQSGVCAVCPRMKKLRFGLFRLVSV